MTVELGHFVTGVPLVPYAFADFEFDGDCRLESIDILTGIEGP